MPLRGHFRRRESAGRNRQRDLHTYFCPSRCPSEKLSDDCLIEHPRQASSKGSGVDHIERVFELMQFSEVSAELIDQGSHGSVVHNRPKTLQEL